jgi:actin, other eukaryote
LYSSGRTSGLIVHSGYDITHSVPIYEGEPIKHFSNRLPLGGKEINEDLLEKLKEKGIEIKYDIVNDIKEKLGSFAIDYDKDVQEINSIVTKEYDLPDGKIIKIGKERVMCTEMLFQPKLYFDNIGVGEVGEKKKYLGAHELIGDSINSFEDEYKKIFWENIVLEGGNTMFDKAYDRFYKEIVSIGPKVGKIKVITPPERKYSVWIGQSLICSMSTSLGVNF